LKSLAIDKRFRLVLRSKKRRPLPVAVFGDFSILEIVGDTDNITFRLIVRSRRSKVCIGRKSLATLGHENVFVTGNPRASTGNLSPGA